MDLAAIEADLKAAAGRRQIVEDYISPALVERLAVTLESQAGRPKVGDRLPSGWHTIFCLQAPPRDALGLDGLPSGNELIPPVAMQRRMFGGARMTFHGALVVGEPVRCESELAETKTRTTPTAQLAIVTLRHRYFGSAGLAVVEEQDIIHMEPTGTAAERVASTVEVMPAPTWRRHMSPDPVMLFRFSALTFNSHRIHYDAPYSAEVERLPGLMVQGKLIALQLLETVRAAVPSARLEMFEYRSGRPLFASGRCALSAKLDETGRSVRLWAEDHKGLPVQTASMTFSAPVSA